jgi:hypothetical protein
VYDWFIAALGTPPEGYEPLAYVAACVVFIMLFDAVKDFLAQLGKFL